MDSIMHDLVQDVYRIMVPKTDENGNQVYEDGLPAMEEVAYPDVDSAAAAALRNAGLGLGDDYTFPEHTLSKIPGYTALIDGVPGDKVPATTARVGDKGNLVIKVTYSANRQQTHIKYVDGSGAVVKDDTANTISGVTDQTIEGATISTPARTGLPNGYHLVSVPTSYKFKAEGNDPIEVVVAKDSGESIPSDPGDLPPYTPEEPTEPDKPADPSDDNKPDQPDSPEAPADQQPEQPKAPAEVIAPSAAQQVATKKQTVARQTPQAQLPQTGDNNDPQKGLMALVLASLAAILAFFKKDQKKRGF